MADSDKSIVDSFREMISYEHNGKIVSNGKADGVVFNTSQEAFIERLFAEIKTLELKIEEARQESLISKTYMIKSLEWVKPKTHSPDWSEVWNVSDDKDGPVFYGIRVTASDGKVTLGVYFDDYSDNQTFEVDCASVDEAKQKAQQHWESENGIGRWLQKVTVDHG